jgi:DNA-binding transcriptional ArsR family regulator
VTVSQKPIYQLKAEFLRALAHPLRIRILELLAPGDLTVGELVRQTGAEPSHVSQQLAVLRSADVLESRREGPHVTYHVVDPRIFHLLATAKEILSTALQRQGELMAELQNMHFDGPHPPAGRSSSIPDAALLQEPVRSRTRSARRRRLT